MSHDVASVFGLLSGPQRQHRPRFVTGLWRCAASLVLVIASSDVAAAEEEDPPASQPVIAEPPPPPPAVAFDRLKSIAQPKPLATGAITHDWRSFLGPTHDSHSTEKPLLAKWPAGGPSRIWEVEKGQSYAAPAIAQGRVILFHRLADSELIECLEAETGRRYWKHEYPTAYRDRYGFGTGPRASPVVFLSKWHNYAITLGAEGRLTALDLFRGTLVWQRDLQKELRAPLGFFGFGSTPLIEGDTLITQVGAPKGGCVFGFDVHNGRIRWKSGTWGASYTSPIPATIHGERRVFVLAGGEDRPPTGGLYCIRPASGSIDFEYPFRAKVYESVSAASPVVVGNRVFLTISYNIGGVMLEIDSDFRPRVAWTTRELGCHFMTPIVADDCLYGIDGEGEANAALVCLAADDGKVRWRDPLEFEETVMRNGAPTKVVSSPGRASLLQLADGTSVCLGEAGHLLRLKLSPKGCEVVERTRLFAAAETWTAPIIADGLLYVMQNRASTEGEVARLICYDMRP